MSSELVTACGYVRLENGDKAIVRRAIVTVGAAATDTNIVTAVTGYKIRVLKMDGVGGAAGSIVLNTKPAGAGTAITAVLPIAASELEVSDVNGICETTVSNGLTATTVGGGATFVGWVTYVLVGV